MYGSPVGQNDSEHAVVVGISSTSMNGLAGHFTCQTISISMWEEAPYSSTVYTSDLVM